MFSRFKCIGIFLSFLILWPLIGSAETDRPNDIGSLVAIRRMDVSRGVFLVKGGKNGSTTFGIRLTTSLYEDEVKPALIKFSKEIDPEKDVIYMGGESMRAHKRDERENMVRKCLSEIGKSNIQVRSIKKFVSFMEKATGLFVELPDGKLLRLSGSSRDEVKKAIANADPKTLELPMLFLGSPLWGEQKENLDLFLKEQLSERGFDYTTSADKLYRPWVKDDKEIEYRSRSRIALEQVFFRPLRVATNLWYRAIWNLPLQQDIQDATEKQRVTAASKVIVNGVISGAFMATGTESWKFIVFFSTINAGLSFFTGSKISSIFNWARRLTDPKSPEKLLRQISLTFTLTYILHAAASLLHGENLVDALVGKNGFGSLILDFLPSGFFQFAFKRATDSGTMKWQDLQFRKPDKSDRILETGAAVNMTYSAIAIFPYLASLFDKTHDLWAGHYLGMDLRFSSWHLFLIGLATWGVITEYRPQLLDETGLTKISLKYDAFLGRFINQPLVSLKQAIAKTYRRTLEKAKNRISNLLRLETKSLAAQAELNQELAGVEAELQNLEAEQAKAAAEASTKTDPATEVQIIDNTQTYENHPTPSICSALYAN